MEWWLEAVMVGLVVALLFTVISRAYQYYRRLYLTLPVWDSSKGHHWNHLEAFHRPGALYCNACTTSVTEGLECDFCGVVVHEGDCVEAVNGRLGCRQLSMKDGGDGPLKHMWVEGNICADSTLPDSDEFYPARFSCAVCEDLCGGGPGLCDKRCAWCQVVVHDRCEPYYTKICDLGKLKTMIIPPNVVQLKRVGIKGRRHWSVSQCSEPAIPNWAPVIVLSNKLSGNGEGELVLRAFRRVLNPVQVVDLSQVPPEFSLEWCRLLPRCTVLIAAGDGTIGWVLETAEKLELLKLPLFAVLPLGTGNDMSRALGWGPGHSGPIDAHSILSNLVDATLVQVDRWAIKIEPSRGSLLRRFNRFNAWRVRNLKMSNYLSIGVDALVTLNFHTSRARLPRVMSGRLMNKFLFFTYGTKDVLERACQKLNRKITLFLDGKFIDLPDIEGIVVLNIPYWGAGVKPWSLGSPWLLDSPISKLGRLTQKSSCSDLPTCASSTASTEATFLTFADTCCDVKHRSETIVNDDISRSVSFKLGSERMSFQQQKNIGKHLDGSHTENLSDLTVPQDSFSLSDPVHPFPTNRTNIRAPVKHTSESPPSLSKGILPNPSFMPQSFNDGLLEVFAIYSSFHIAQMQIGLSEPCRLGQASEVKIVVKSSSPSLGGVAALPMQTDGEPWLQGPSVITITKSGVVEMLAAPNAAFSSATSSSPGSPVF